MKASLLGLTFVLAAGSLPAAGEIQPGASLAEVQAAMGAPRGRIQVGERQILSYERGTVELQNGTLTRMDLRTPEEHAIVVAREERLRVERVIRRNRMLVEGTALREARMADASFQASPFAYQVAFWEDFARNYPEVPCGELLAIARMHLNEQRAEQRRQDEQARQAEYEEQLAAAQHRSAYSDYYLGRVYASGYGRLRHPWRGLGPVTYTFFDSSLPPYSTPSGNLTGPSFNLPVVNPAWPGRHNDHLRPDTRGPQRGTGAGRNRGRM